MGRVEGKVALVVGAGGGIGGAGAEPCLGRRAIVGSTASKGSRGQGMAITAGRCQKWSTEY